MSFGKQLCLHKQVLATFIRLCSYLVYVRLTITIYRYSYAIASIVNRSNAWLEHFDANNVKVKMWAVRKDTDFFHRNLCSDDLKYSQGFQSIYQHSNKPKHKSLLNLRFGNNCRRFLTKDTTVPVDKASPSSSQNHHITFDPT